MKYIKENLYFSIIFTIIGVISLGISLFYIDNSVLFGFGTAASLVGVIQTIQYLKYMKSEDKCREIEMMKTEERAVFIREKTNSKVYSIFIYIESMCCVISAVLGYKYIAFIFAILGICKLIAWFVIGSKIAKNN